jgi:hypothetical protein
MILAHEEDFQSKITKATQFIKRMTVHKFIFDKERMENALRTKIPPRCIFLPSVPIIRRMIDLIVAREEDETDENFLLKFGLLQEKLTEENVNIGDINLD